MSARYHRSEHVHPFPWPQVASAFFLRYPNPFSTHVLSEDTLLRTVEGSKLYSRRFLTKTNKLPKWGETFFKNFKKMVPLVEESVIDVKTKEIVTYTRNVGLSRFMSAVEKVRYVEHPQQPGHTLAVKEAWIESGLYGLRTAVKSAGVERFKANCQRATEGFNVVLARMQERRQAAISSAGRLRQAARQAAEAAAHHTSVAAQGKANEKRS